MPGCAFRFFIIDRFPKFWGEIAGRQFVAYNGFSHFYNLGKYFDLLISAGYLCNGCALVVVATGLDHSLSTAVWARRLYSVGGISCEPCRILVDARLCNRVSTSPRAETLVDALLLAVEFPS